VAEGWGRASGGRWIVFFCEDFGRASGGRRGFLFVRRILGAGNGECSQRRCLHLSGRFCWCDTLLFDAGEQNTAEKKDRYTLSFMVLEFFPPSKWLCYIFIQKFCKNHVKGHNDG
jgi:hypothetical protein